MRITSAYLARRHVGAPVGVHKPSSRHTFSLVVAAASFAFALAGEDTVRSPHAVHQRDFFRCVAVAQGRGARLTAALPYVWQRWSGQIATLLLAGYYRCAVMVVAPAGLASIASALSWPVWPASVVLWQHTQRLADNPAELVKLLCELAPVVVLLRPLPNYTARLLVTYSSVPVVGQTGSALTNAALWHSPTHHAYDLTSLASGFSLCWALWQGRRLGFV